MSHSADAADHALSALEEHLPEAARALKRASQAVQAAARRVFGASDFVAEAVLRDPQLLPQLLAQASGHCEQPLPLAAASASGAAADDSGFLDALRAWRRAELVRIAWRDLAGWADLSATLQDLSNAADTAIRHAESHAWNTLAARHGSPTGADAAARHLLVLAMGKLGGRELNFSSDVDLIFLYGAQGQTAGERAISHEEFFTRLGQALIRSLDAVTAQGRAWRVDMRLRPFGASGPLVASLAAVADYLESQGRDWERYAWIKARAVTGEALYEPWSREAVRPFVYRRYLDFGVFAALREMKALLEREVERRELKENIKLGPGGIREIEFIVQSLQLIRGGSERRLQSPSLLATLPRLAGAKLLPDRAVAELAAAYEFLRRLENRLQMYADQQTHDLPAEPRARARLAESMGCGSWDELAGRLDVQRRCVSGHFAALVRGPTQAGARGVDLQRLPAGGTRSAGGAGEGGEEGMAELAARLSALGWREAAGAARLLHDVPASALMRRLDATGRQRLLDLLGVLAAEVAAAPEALLVLRRLLRVCEAIGARSAYFALLLESAAARARLVDLARHGDFLIEQIAAYPLLLDELVDPRLLEQLPTRTQLTAELAQRLAEVEDGDEERQVEQLRHLQRAALFRIALADLGGRIGVMTVSDRLTELAEIILEQALQLAWRYVTAQYGIPHCGSDAERREVRICAVGYGKLGGMELGYGSDLDLVFLHDSSGVEQVTVGARVVDNQVFFARFVQRLVHLLTMHSAAGRLYEVDMRLRPSGKGGMFVTSLEAFERYQLHEAWTWEHQALLHARAVAGDPTVRARFELLRCRILEHGVRRADLREQVGSMRRRMRSELAVSEPGRFDIKQGSGGVADIEFLAQYWALYWAKQYPPLIWFADTIRQLESLASAALVPQQTIDTLTAAYRRYRECVHHLSIAGQPARVADAQFAAEREAVSRIWAQAMGV